MSRAVILGLLPALAFLLVGCLFAKAALPTPTAIPATPTTAPPTITPLPTSTPEPTATPQPKLYGNFNASISSPYGYPIVPLNHRMTLFLHASNDNDVAISPVVELKGPLTRLGIEDRNGPVAVADGQPYRVAMETLQPRQTAERVLWFDPTGLGHVDLTVALLTQEGVPILDENDNPQMLSFSFMVR